MGNYFSFQLLPIKDSTLTSGPGSPRGPLAPGTPTGPGGPFSPVCPADPCFPGGP